MTKSTKAKQPKDIKTEAERQMQELMDDVELKQNRIISLLEGGIQALQNGVMFQIWIS